MNAQYQMYPATTNGYNVVPSLTMTTKNTGIAIAPGLLCDDGGGGGGPCLKVTALVYDDVNLEKYFMKCYDQNGRLLDSVEVPVYSDPDVAYTKNADKFAAVSCSLRHF